MRTRIIRIGNSQGLRIPKSLLERSGLTGEVELQANDGELIVRPAQNPREGWEESFIETNARGDDELLDGGQPGSSWWDEEEWEWE